MLLDTSGLLSLFDCSAVFTRTPSKPTAGLPAFCSTTTSGRVHPTDPCAAHAAPRVIRLPDRSAAHPRVELIWVDEAVHQSAMDLLRQRLDKSYSLCDAVNFVVMREKGVSEALTTDHHFEQEGFVRLLK